MRHNKKFNHLGRTSAHRNAMLSNMSVSLIMHKRIFTTVAKAKALKKVIEPIITKCKDDTTHSRRLVFQELQSKQAVTELFQNVSQKVADRPGGYTRIIKTGNRLGDNASMCFIELVDYNENMLKDGKAAAKTKTRRSRSGKKSTTAEKAAPAVEEVKEEVADTVAEEPKAKKKAAAPKVEEPKVEEVVAEAEAKVEEQPAEEPAPETEAKEEEPKAE